jgi:hypothetical protein
VREKFRIQMKDDDDEWVPLEGFYPTASAAHLAMLRMRDVANSMSGCPFIDVRVEAVDVEEE